MKLRTVKTISAITLDTKSFLSANPERGSLFISDPVGRKHMISSSRRMNARAKAIAPCLAMGKMNVGKTKIISPNITSGNRFSGD